MLVFGIDVPLVEIMLVLALIIVVILAQAIVVLLLQIRRSNQLKGERKQESQVRGS